MLANPIPLIIVWHMIIKLFCFSDDTSIKILENRKEVLKKVSEIKKDEMVLAFDGKEKR